MSNNILARYSFVPWMRKGLARKTPIVDTLGSSTAGVAERATIPVGVKLKVEADTSGNSDKTVNKTAQLIGPGDIIGIQKKAVARIEPKPGIDEMEPNYLPYIEFYDEDFPWRYTPAMPDSGTAKKLTPWITLIVLAESEYTYNSNVNGILPFIAVEQKYLPNLAEQWAYAHVHVSDEIEDPDTNNKVDWIRKNDPHRSSSRILGSRKLNASTRYRAFLVPSFETGRLAGMDDLTNIGTTDALKFAWTYNAAGTAVVNLPVYYDWQFTTDETGDFEHLLNQLVPRPVDPLVGTRKMDVRNPGPGLDDLFVSNITTEYLGLGGALRSPFTVQYNWVNGTEENLFKDRLTEILNLDDSIMQTGWSAPTWMPGSGDPVITAPIYGRWHAKVVQVTNSASSNWVNEINLNMENRAAAGLGTDIMINKQEEYMDRAWEQLGDVLEANQRIMAAYYAELASLAAYDKHIAGRTDDSYVNFTSHFHDRATVDTGGSTESASYHVDSTSLTTSTSIVVKKLVNRNSSVSKKATAEINTTGVEFQDSFIANVNDATMPDVTAAVPKYKPVEFMDNYTAASTFATQIAGYQSGSQSSPGYPTSGTNPNITNHNIFQDIIDYYGQYTEPAPAPEMDMSQFRSDLDVSIYPETQIRARWNTGVFQEGVSVVLEKPIMAEPRFGDPMYEKLRDISSDYIIPNIHMIQENTITLLETNPQFIESYMVGLNHEMSRELMWREYPTDQRGTYFTQFWSVKDHVHLVYPPVSSAIMDDIKPIGEWPLTTDLGDSTHKNVGSSPSTLVLLVRGKLLQKYPNAVIYAHPADIRRETTTPYDPDPYSTQHRNFLANVPPEDVKFPIFKASVAPDILLFGFDLTATEAMGDVNNTTNYPDTQNFDYPGGYYFVIKEREGDIRFGMDVNNANFEYWNDLAWNHVTKNANGYIDLSASFTGPSKDDPQTNGGDPLIPDDSYFSVSWKESSADMAYAFYQLPAGVAVHANKLLKGLV